MFNKRTLVLFSLGVALAGSASAAVLTLPDSSLSSTFSADVSEQATCTVPSTIHFTVSNIAASTASSTQNVDCESVVLADGNALKISLEADGANFAFPAGGATAYAAGDVSWTAVAWTGGVGGLGTSGTLSTSFGAVATSTANAGALSTTALVFTLAVPGTAPTRSGSYTLGAHWKFESI
jgi:hypothetical protein